MLTAASLAYVLAANCVLRSEGVQHNQRPLVETLRVLIRGSGETQRRGRRPVLDGDLARDPLNARRL
jgi:hypothetical protein